ncbi:MAG: hypothetical protein GY791_08055 [Alphaproteobacteria bacterium]|nr:hypothetical protein [Alphaproteobacteria bacterium]
MRVIAIIAAASMVGFAAQAAEKEMSLSDVPETVMDAAHDASEGVTFDSVLVEDIGDGLKYGLSGTRADGSKVGIDVDDEGEVIEFEEHLTMDAVPAVVKATLDKYLPGMNVTEIERAVKDDSSVIYEFEGTDADGVEVDVDVTWDGSEITIETGA